MTISKETQKNISKAIGADFMAVMECDPAEENSLICKTVGFSKSRDLRRIGRGNPLLARHKIRTIEDVNVKLARIK